MPERPSSAVSVRGAARARELTVHAAILAAAVWAFVGADVISPGPLGRYSGFPKGNDFVQFYVAGSLARDGDFGALADAARFRQAQARFLGPGATVSFPPVYGPQVALFFSAFARLPYLTAYALWAALSLALTLWSVSACRRRVPALAAWPWPVTVAAVAYPPLGYLVLDGQLSALALAACALAVVGLARGSRVAAGAAIGLLGYKVSLFAPAVAVCFLAGEWTMVATAAGVAALQVGLAIPIVGIGGVAGYLHNLLVFARSPDLLTRNPYLMASFRTFWSALLPAPAAAAAYVLSAGASLAAAAWGWRRDRLAGGADRPDGARHRTCLPTSVPLRPGDPRTCLRGVRRHPR